MKLFALLGLILIGTAVSFDGVGAYNTYGAKQPDGCITHQGDAANEVGQAIQAWGQHGNVRDCRDGDDISFRYGDPGDGALGLARMSTFGGVIRHCAITVVPAMPEGREGSLRQVIEHEVGHCLGLDHSDEEHAQMWHKCCNDIGADDAAGIAYLYPFSSPTPPPTVQPTQAPSTPSATPPFGVPPVTTPPPTASPTPKVYRYFIPGIAK